MSTLFFFTDLDLLDDAGAFAQTSVEAYGPLNATQFRLNSKHKSNSTSAPTAYAVTKGHILIHPIPGDNTHVNLILRPIDQPAENKGIGLPRIKCLVYQNILKDSLIASGSNPATFVPDGTIDMIDKIRSTYPGRGNAEVPVDNFLTSGTPTDSIDGSFSARSLPPILAGESIGLFDPNGFGFAVLLDDLGFEPDLALASWNHDTDYLYTVPQPSSSNADQFTARAKREYVLHFMDSCALFGSSYLTGLEARRDKDTKVSINGQKRSERNKLYTVISKFYNRDRAYIDIRGENNRSFNYYYFVDDPAKRDLFSIYIDNIGLGFSNSAGTLPSTPTSYYSDGWPILIVKNSQFPSGSTGEKNIVSIRMPSGNNPRPSSNDPWATLFFTLGLHNEGNADGEIKLRTAGSPIFEDLVLHPSKVDYEPFELIIPNNQDAGTTTIIPTYSRVKYIRHVSFVDLFTTPTDTEVQYLDNLFAPVLLKDMTGGVRPSTYETEQYVDLSNGDQIAKLEYIGNTQIEFGLNTVTLACYPVHERRRHGEAKSNPTLGSGLRSATLERYTSAAGAPASVKEPPFIIQTLNLPPYNPKLVYYDRGPALVSRWLSNGDFAGVVLVTIDKSNFQSKIIDVIQGPNASNNFSPGFDVHLCIASQSHRDQNESNDNDLSNPAIPFSQCSLLLRGFKLDNGNVRVVEVNTGIQLYTKREPDFTIHTVLRDRDAVLQGSSVIQAYTCDFKVGDPEISPASLKDKLTNIYNGDLTDFIRDLYKYSATDATSKRLYQYIFSKFIKTKPLPNAQGLMEPEDPSKIELQFANGVLSSGNQSMHQGLLLEAANYFAIWKITQGLQRLHKALGDIALLSSDDYESKVLTLKSGLNFLIAQYPFFCNMVEALKAEGIRSPIQIIDADSTRSLNLTNIKVLFGRIFIDNNSASKLTSFVEGYIETHDRPGKQVSSNELRSAIGALDATKQKYINEMSHCVYEGLGGALTEYTFLNCAIGDGSQTLGLFGLDDGSQGPGPGVFLFRYFYDNQVKPLSSVPLSRQPISDRNDNPFMVHFGIYGIDPGLSFSHSIRIFNREGSNAFGIDPSSQKLVDAFTLVKESPSSFKSNVTTASGLASWNNFTKDLLIVNPKTNGYSSIGISLDSPGEDEQTFSIAFYKTTGTTANAVFAKSFENLFADDSFVLTTTKKSALWEAREIESLKNVVEALKGDAELKLLSMVGGGIGKKKTTSSAAEYQPGSRYPVGTVVLYNDGNFYRSLEYVMATSVLNPSQWILQSAVETDPDFVFVPPTSQSPSDPWARVREDDLHDPVAGSQQELEYAQLRYSYASIVFDAIANELNITVESYASPLFSRLDESKTLLFDGEMVPAGLTPNQWKCLTDSTIYAQNLDSQAYVKNAPPAPGKLVRDAFNPLLSALRCCGLLDALLERIRLEVSLDSDSAAYNRVSAKIDSFKDNLSVKVNLTAPGPGVHIADLDLVKFKKIVNNNCP